MSFKDETSCYVAAVGVLFYETCITLDREGRHIWRRRLSAASWIFLLNRYLVLWLYLVNLALSLGGSDASARSCSVLVRISQVLSILPYIVWAAFSGLRVYAVVCRGWHISLLVVCLSLVPVGTYIFRDFHEKASTNTSSQECVTMNDYPFQLDARACLILSDLLVLSVTWKKTYGIVRLAKEHRVNSSFSVTTVLLRDGSAYFTVWTILNTLHIVATYVPEVEYITIFTDGFTAILVSRFILNLRDAASGTELDQHVASLSPFDYSWRPADNTMPSFLEPLGALLEHSVGTYTDPDGGSVSGHDSVDFSRIYNDIEMPRIGLKDV